MAGECCTTEGNIMILTCSGGSNVGQLANRTAVELTQEGYGKMYCLAGIGGHLGGFIQSARDVPEMIAIDGCSVGCAKAMLEHAEVSLKKYLVVTDLGIEKNKNFDLIRDEIDRIKDAVRETVGVIRPEQAVPGTGKGFCCD